jgi:hypothetical protein
MWLRWRCPFDSAQGFERNTLRLKKVGPFDFAQGRLCGSEEESPSTLFRPTAQSGATDESAAPLV